MAGTAKWFDLTLENEENQGGEVEGRRLIRVERDVGACDCCCNRISNPGLWVGAFFFVLGVLSILVLGFVVMSVNFE